MIDLHCHILPGLDDGPADVETMLRMARVAEADGITTIVATPHIRDDYPFDPLEIAPLAAQVNESLRRAGVELDVLTGGEVSLAKSMDLDDQALRALTLGDGPYVLVESPYTTATDMLEHTLFGLQTRGFRPVLAHPERSPSFLEDIERLREVVGRGVLCSVTAGSMEGRFGRTVKRFCLELFREGLVHNVASDAHDPERRRPELVPAFETTGRQVPGLDDQVGWYTLEAPGAILAGERLPQRPDVPRRGGALSRLLRVGGLR